ncbi:MAG TPA: Fe-Mn family superoxide dismutase [Aestuariivirga sp.]|nr:Fe-Mn family superoxide dismutase [Aestuariivirga sp.]
MSAPNTTMRYFISPLFCRPWTLNGMSPQLIESHYVHNYGAALNRLNVVTEELERIDIKTTAAPVVSRLKQEQTSLLNSTLLHELYFASLGGDGRTLPEALSNAIARDFSSVDRWRAEFRALAEALGGDAGWILLTYVPRDRRLMNQSTTDHTQCIAGGIPILALDMYEHAYHIEYGANPTAYIAAFMRNIHWLAVEARYNDATKVAPPRALEQPEFDDLPSIAPEELQAMIKSGQKVQIIDTRPRHYSTRAQDMVDGAVWRDPERIDEWIGELARDQPVVTFCVYGFHIGCQSAAVLRKAGFDARYMRGGHYAWKAIKGTVKLFA